MYAREEYFTIIFLSFQGCIFLIVWLLQVIIFKQFQLQVAIACKNRKNNYTISSQHSNSLFYEGNKNYKIFNMTQLHVHSSFKKRYIKECSEVYWHLHMLKQRDYKCTLRKKRKETEIKSIRRSMAERIHGGYSTTLFSTHMLFLCLLFLCYCFFPKAVRWLFT